MRPSAEVLAELRDRLCPEEQARADRFRVVAPKEAFIAARAQLRLILSKYLNQSHDRIHFVYGASGKPALADGDTGYDFNVSHSGDCALIAISGSGSIGVDVERFREVKDLAGLADQFLTEAEQRDLFALSDHPLREAFFSAWTRKEAVVKAMGRGIGYPFKNFETGCGPCRGIRWLADPPDDHTAWSLTLLNMPREYAASLVTCFPLERTQVIEASPEELL